MNHRVVDMTSTVTILDTFSLDPNVVQYSSTRITSPPFVIQGSTTSVPPENKNTATTYTKIGSGTPNINPTPSNSTTPSEYKASTIQLNNILFGNDYCQGSTLVDLVGTATPRYTLAFIAIHDNDLKSSAYNYQKKSKATANTICSIVFRNGNDIYHIQIPICATDCQLADVNPFLRTWLFADKQATGSYSVNQLFKFSGTVAEFDTFAFALNYNQNSSKKFVGKYTICLFKTPHTIPLNGQYDTLVINPTLATFDSIFNYAMQGPMKITYPSFPLQISPDRHIAQILPNTFPLSTFYSLPIHFLLNTPAPPTTNRKLNSVKCYPIDLVSQVDDTGAIFIDEETSRPVDVRQATGTSIEQVPSISVAVPTTQFSYINLIIALVVFIILLLIGICVFIYVFKNRFIVNPMVEVAPMPNVVSAPAAPAPLASGVNLPRQANQ